MATLVELGFAVAVIDDRDLDEARPDVEADRGLLATEECHGETGVSGGCQRPTFASFTCRRVFSFRFAETGATRLAI